jgi:hypothetical protein
MVQGIHFSGAYDCAALPGLVPGGWYIGFACKRCGQHFAILNEPTDTGTLDMSGSASFKAACPNCGDEGVYSAADLVQFQAAQGGPSSTP